MPRGDRTGPDGTGPMTGRGAGYCAGYAMPGFANPVGRTGRCFGRGAAGAGMGFGRGAGGYRARAWGGRRNWVNPEYYAVPTREEELAMLTSESQGLKYEIKAVEERMKELESSADDKK